MLITSKQKKFKHNFPIELRLPFNILFGITNKLIQKLIKNNIDHNHNIIDVTSYDTHYQNQIKLFADRMDNLTLKRKTIPNLNNESNKDDSETEIFLNNLTKDNKLFDNTNIEMAENGIIQIKNIDLFDENEIIVTNDSSKKENDENNKIKMETVFDGIFTVY